MTPTENTQDTDTKTLWANFTVEQRRKIEEIAAWQTSVGMSDLEFVAGCANISAQSWYQLRTGRYGAKNCSRMVAIASAHAVQRRSTWSKSQTLITRPLAFIETQKFLEVIEAVESANTAADIGDDDKIVWVVGESGSGKTEIARQIRDRKAGSMVTASESWRDGYLDALTDVARALGCPQPTNANGQDKAWSSKGTAERAIIEKLTAHPRILCINEVEFFSKRVLNLMRKIADETRTVIVIFCVPEFYEEILRQGGAYARQLRTRTEGVVWLDHLEKSDVSKLLQHYWPKADHSESAKDLAAYANKFGGWRVAKRIARNLRGQFPQPDNAPSSDDMRAAIAVQKVYQDAAF